MGVTSIPSGLHSFPSAAFSYLATTVPITADMSHKNLGPLAAGIREFQELQRHSPMIHITTDGSDGTYILKTFRDGYVNDVSACHNLVAFGEILSIPVIPVAG